MILQSGGESSTILIELFLFLITLCAGYGAWKGKQIYGRFDEQAENIENLQEQVNMNSMQLVGQDGTPYDGVVPEVQKNTSRLDNHRTLLKRIKRTLQRQGHLSDESYLDDIETDDDIIPDGGDMDDFR